MKSTFLVCVFWLSTAWLHAQVYSVVLSKGNAGTKQVYGSTTDFPTEKIEAYKKEGFLVDGLQYGGDEWVLVASDRKDIKEQSYAISETFPEDEINSNARKGLYLIDLCYGKSDNKRVWATIYGKGLPYDEQILVQGETFPYEEVQQKLIEGYRIMDIAIGKDLSVVVMVNQEKNGIVSQDFFITDEVPNEFITRKTQTEFPSFLTHFSYQDNKWYTVTSFGTKYQGQYHSVQKAVPTNSINQGWSEGYVVTSFQKFFYKREYVNGEIPKYLTDYQGRVHCNDIMSARQFKKLLNTVTNISLTGIDGDDLKLQTIRDLMYAQEMCICTAQLAQLVNLFEFDASRYEIIEMFYPHMYDVDNLKEFEAALGNDDLLKKKFKALLKKSL